MQITQNVINSKISRPKNHRCSLSTCISWNAQYSVIKNKVLIGGLFIARKIIHIQVMILLIVFGEWNGHTIFMFNYNVIHVMCDTSGGSFKVVSLSV